MSQRPNEPVLPTEPDPDAYADEDGFSHYAEFDKKRRDMLKEKLGVDLDAFDLLCQLAFDRKGLTRGERADKVRSKPGYLEKYGKSACNVLDVVLTRFSENGYMTLDDMLDQSRLVYFLQFATTADRRPGEVPATTADQRIARDGRV